MRPLVRSYGVSSTSTSSPVRTRMRFLRIFPAVWPRTSWPFSRRTRNIALGSSSTTCPRISSNSSLAKLSLFLVGKKPRRLSRAHLKREGAGAAASGGIIFGEKGFDASHPILKVLGAAEVVLARLVEDRRHVRAGLCQRVDHLVALLRRHRF